MSFYMFAKKTLGKFILKFFFRCKVSGSENMPQSGGVLVCSNHISNNDAVIIACALDRQVKFMAKSELFKFKPFGNLLRTLGAFPVNRKLGDVGAIKNSVNILNEGGVVGIFPQGGRRKGVHPKDTSIRNGAGMIQTRTGCIVLPVAICSKKNKILPIFRRVFLNIGSPMLPEDFSDCLDKENKYELVSKRIFEKILEQYDLSTCKK